jgi:uncharacterized protein (TIGR03435 family)
MTFTNVSLGDLIQAAYDVKAYQVSGPGWIESARFDIEAKVPAGATKEQSRLMMRSLLADRFKLVLHHSEKEASIYALLVAKNGPKLRESAKAPADDPNAPPPPDGPPGKRMQGAPRGGTSMRITAGRMSIVSNATTISNFLGALASQLDRPVVDMTGLTGTYDITLVFAPDSAGMRAKMAAMGVAPPPGADGGAAGNSSPDADAPASIFSALPDQLGLRLEARKGPLDMLVVDSIQKTPTEN